MTVNQILEAIRKRRHMSRPNLYATYFRPMGIKPLPGRAIPKHYPPDTVNRIFGEMGIFPDDEPKHQGNGRRHNSRRKARV